MTATRLAGLICLLGLSPSSALAFEVDIAEPGYHRLEADVTASGMGGVRISVDGVSLNLNGHTVRCAPPDPATAVTHGVHAPDRRDIRIFNGRITGCMFGANLADAEDVSVVDVDFTGTTFVGVHLQGARGAEVRASTFANISGYTSQAYAIGVNGVGDDALIEGNIFVDIARQPAAEGVGEGVAVLIASGSDGVTIRRNFIENGAGPAEIAIWVARDTTEVRLVRNVISGYAIPIRGQAAAVERNRVLLSEPVEGSVAVHLRAAEARGNVLIGFETPFPETVTDAGGNVIVARALLDELLTD